MRAWLLLFGISVVASASNKPCLDAVSRNLVQRIQAVSIHPNSARGEEKKLLATEISNQFHEDLAAIASSWRARDEAPLGKRLGTMTYYPVPIKNEPQIIEQFVLKMPENKREMYRQILSEFSDRNRVRMREYVVGDASADPYSASDVNRGFSQSDAMVYKDSDGTPTRFFNVEWKIKIDTHQGVNISERNANIKPSLPVPNKVFTNFLKGKLSDESFSATCLRF